MALSYTVQGKQVNNVVISAFAKRIGSIDDVLSVWANAATLQIVQHGNRNWLDSLFDMPSLRLKNRELSKTGKDVLGYIKAHCPVIVWNKDNQTIGMQKIGKDNILAHSFIAVGHTSPIDGLVTEINGKYYTPHGDFSLTLTGYKNIERPAKEVSDEEPSVMAKAVIKQMDKAFECAEKGRFVGTLEELFSASIKAKQLMESIQKQIELAASAEADKLAKLRTIEETGPIVELAPKDMTLDTAKADELHKSGQAGKAKRAGDKVAPKDAATAPQADAA